MAEITTCAHPHFHASFSQGYNGVWKPRNSLVLSNTQCTNAKELHRQTLIKKKIEFFSYMRKFRREQLQSHVWGRLSNIWGNAQIFSHKFGGRYSYTVWLCNCSLLNFLIYEENFILFFISVPLAFLPSDFSLKKVTIMKTHNKDSLKRSQIVLVVLFHFLLFCAFFSLFSARCHELLWF